MEVVDLLKTISPEAISILEKRYLILKSIWQKQPIGRRALSLDLGFRERTVREEISILREQGLLKIDSKGMYVTEKTENLLTDLGNFYNNLKGLPQLEAKLEELLKVKRVLIVAGDSMENKMVLKDMSKASYSLLKEILEDKDTLGITGGNTMAALANEAVYDLIDRDILVTPARGGLGKDLNTQSNSIAARLAEGLGASYSLLYVPDNIEQEAMDYILKNEEISQSIKIIDQMDSLVFGIGRADTMAARRSLSQERIDRLKADGAVSEAFGHFFDIRGREIWEYKTIGLSLERFKSLKKLIGVAGGQEKAQAIISVANLNKNMILVMDQAAAEEIVKIV